MRWFDWLIVIVPVLFVLGVGMYSRKYLRDVTTFLSAGRVCGRYVIAVGDVAEMLSILGLVAYVEVHYRTGFATSFWASLLTPLAIALSLFGYCHYRFRETKAQSLGQYIEMRYSRKLRVLSAALRTFSEILANMIMPALAARFFIYFLDIPQEFMLFGLEISTFHLIMVIVLVLAISIICMGGAMAVCVTDTIQGFICYPMLVLFVIFILTKFSWSNEMLPVMMDRVEGESFLDPRDVSHLRDFNVFSLLLLPVLRQFLHRMNWMSSGAAATAARSPHEQKMANLIGSWRSALGAVFYVLIAVAVITMLNHHKFATEAHNIRVELTTKVTHEIVKDPAMRQQIFDNIQKLESYRHIVGVSPKLSEKKSIDTLYLQAGRSALTAEDVDEGNAAYAKFRALYYQLMLPVTLRNMLPQGMLGLFCLLMVLLMISTDDSRIFSSASTLVQDLVLPFIKKQLTPSQHMWLIRWVAIGVGVIFFLGSSFMSQLDYINLFVSMMTTMWSGACGPMLVFGLYSRFGTTAGAWTSLLTGMVMGMGGVLVNRNWASTIYPWLRDMDLLDGVTKWLFILSKPFHPWVVWEMNAVRCPINSYEWLFITTLVSLVLFCVVSWLTCKTPFNLQRMLHRGKYALDGERVISSPWTKKNFYNKLIGITPEYTLGDRIITWCYFFYSFIYRFFFTFVAVVVWNIIDPWPLAYWGWYFLICYLVVPGFMAAVTAVWFGICGPIDLYRMFRDLENKVINHLDNGVVEGNMSLADKAELEAIDKAPAKPEKQ